MISVSVPFAVRLTDDSIPWYKRATSLGVAVMCGCVIVAWFVWGIAIDVQRVLDAGGLTLDQLPTAELLTLERAERAYRIAFFGFLGAYCLAFAPGASTWFGEAVGRWLAARRERRAAEVRAAVSSRLQRRRLEQWRRGR